MKDKHDDTGFRHSRDRHLGVSISNEFYQPVPMFFTREGAMLNMIGHYRGCSAFLICNGPSFAALDHSLLKKPGIMTLGMNNGAKTFRPNFWTCVDDPSRFLKSIWMDPYIQKFIPQAHFEKKIFDGEKWEITKTKVGDCPNVIGYRRNEKFVAERFLFEDTFNWGNHKNYGGGRSVMLPAIRILFLLGFRNVYLLGCDFNMTEESTYHFDEQRLKGAVNCNKSTYKRLQTEYFPQLKPQFDAEGFNVYNCYKDSGLKVFPYISFENAVKEATSKLGDVDSERSWGMYSKPDDKSKWKQEPLKKDKKNIASLEKLEKEKLEKIRNKVQKIQDNQEMPELNNDVIAISENDRTIALPENNTTIITPEIIPEIIPRNIPEIQIPPVFSDTIKTPEIIPPPPEIILPNTPEIDINTSTHQSTQ